MPLLVHNMDFTKAKFDASSQGNFKFPLVDIKVVAVFLHTDFGQY